MTTMNSPRTLADRLTESRIPVPEALHYAMSLADSLRKIHDAGNAHGAVTPSSIAVTATGLDLIPSPGPQASVTPYTAPEVPQGSPADARSDIFSFGAVVFELLTGRPAFEGEGQTTLTTALVNCEPAASGSPAVDRLVAGCLAKNPAARWQRMQKIIMELKMFTVAARRADAAPHLRGVSDAALRSEIQLLEERLAARLAAHQKSVAEMQQSTGDAVQALREQLAAVVAELTAVKERPVPPPVDVESLLQQIRASLNETVEAVRQQLVVLVEEKVGSVTQQVNRRIDENVAAATQEHAMQGETFQEATRKLGARVDETVGAVNQRMALVEQAMEDIRKHFATLQSKVANDLHEFEHTLKMQSASVDSARTAMSQTDDLVERVVEALELLQSSVLDQNETSMVN